MLSLVLRLLLIGLILSVPAQARIARLGGGGGASGGTQTIVSVAPSAASFTQGSTAGTPVTGSPMTATMSPASPPFSGAFALSTTLDICNGTNGANNNLLQVSGAALQVSAAGAAAATGTYKYCIAASQSGITPKGVAGTLTISSSGGGLALAPTFNETITTPSQAFWMIGYPMAKGAVPVNGSVTATLGGSTVRVAACNAGGPLLHSDSSPRWYRLLVDASGLSVSSSSLVLTPSSTPWSSTSGRSAADFKALNRTSTLTAVVGSTAGSIAGTWTADFSNNAGTGTGTIFETDTICTTPLGNLYRVKANYVNGSTSFATACGCTAVPVAEKFFWVTQTSGGTLGPIVEWGTYTQNYQMFGTNTQLFTATMTDNWNGVQHRQQVGIPITAGTQADLIRIDGQGDWTANDPAFTVTWDYTKVRATQTIPPYISGISYTGNSGLSPATTSEAISAVSSTGVFTVPSMYGLTDITYFAPTSIDLTGSFGSLTGLSANTTYWQCALTSTTFEIFTSYAAASAVYTGPHTCPTPGTTNIVPGGTGSYAGGLSAEASAAPENNGLVDLGFPDSGNHSDLTLFWTPEVAMGGLLVGSTAWERLSRVAAYSMESIPFQYLAPTGCIAPLVNSTVLATITGNCANGTSSLGATAYPNTGNPDALWIGGLTSPTGGTGQYSLNSAHFPGTTAHYVELLEGAPELEDQLIQFGERGISQVDLTGYVPREFQVAGTGTTYSPSILTACDSAQVRKCGWAWRDLGLGAWWAPEGSAEQGYFRKAMLASVNGINAYAAYEGANYSAIGYLQDADTGGTTPVISDGPPYMAMFMYNYTNMAATMNCALNGEFVSGLCALTDTMLNGELGLYASPACPYWATSFTMAPGTSDVGGATPFGTVSSPSLIGMFFEQNASIFASFNGSNGQVTIPNLESDSGTTFTIKVGDQPSFNNWGEDGNTGNDPPSGITPGVRYCVKTVVSTAADTTTVLLATTCGGTAITGYGSSPTGVGVAVVPSGQTCPAPSAGGYGAQFPSDTNSYNFWNIFTLGSAAANFNAGLSSQSSAPAAYTAGTALSSPMPGICATQANSCTGSSY